MKIFPHTAWTKTFSEHRRKKSAIEKGVEPPSVSFRFFIDDEKKGGPVATRLQKPQKEIPFQSHVSLYVFTVVLAS